MFLRKVKEAVEQRSEQVVAFEQFHTSLATGSTTLWLQAVEEWERDPKKVNPFVPTQRGEYVPFY